jgi:raffinose/stachyose/melibiose transport system substrate-binding protein
MNISFGRHARHRMAIALSAVALLAGASSASAQTVIKWLHLETNAGRLGTWQEIAADYEAANPGVKIEFQFLENEAYKAKLPTLLQSNDAPSMFYTWAGGVLEAQIATGALRDITPALDADNGAWRNSINKAAVDAMTFDGKVWAAPVQSGVVSFFYNKALFEQAGVDGEAIGTWGEFLAAVQKLKDAGITPIAGGGGDKWPLHFYWSYLAMREVGQEAFNAAKNGEGFQSEGFVRASQKLTDLGAMQPFQEGYLGATWPDTTAAFADGRAAILLGFENTATPTIQAGAATDDKGQPQENLGRFPFPVVEGAPGLITDDFGGINGWVVTANAPPETEDFLKFFTNKDNSAKIADRNAILPTTIGAEVGIKDASMAAAAAQKAKATWHQNYLDQDLGPNVGRVVNDMSVELAAGQLSPEEALQQIQDTFSLEM